MKIDNAQKISKTHEMSHMIKIHKKEKRDKKKKKNALDLRTYFKFLVWYGICLFKQKSLSPRSKGVGFVVVVVVVVVVLFSTTTTTVLRLSFVVSHAALSA